MPETSEGLDKLIKVVISLILVVIIILISIWFKLSRYVERYNLAHKDGMDLYHDPYNAHLLAKYRSVSDTPGMSDGPDPESEQLIGASRSSDYFNPYANYDRGLISNANVQPVTFDGMMVVPPKTAISKKVGGSGDFAFSEAALGHDLRHGN